MDGITKIREKLLIGIPDVPVVFYTGDEPFFDDRKGHVVMPDVPLAVFDKTGGLFCEMNHPDLFVTGSNFHYGGGGYF